ncbi:hypothetical protein L486_07707 [Kwoniella mangroviensis CBS 10435]|uniref:Uncharacterized protein n=1 Tax=Kwoniella mangroviensis CBS 10435 TaxID=1331196 RepID=A0A1B9IG63_9TREE|nr:hypothetical protein L486_07707 [Kwoniella mangroviensis CBS 10435]
MPSIAAASSLSAYDPNGPGSFITPTDPEDPTARGWHFASYNSQTRLREALVRRNVVSDAGTMSYTMVFPVFAPNVNRIFHIPLTADTTRGSTAMRPQRDRDEWTRHNLASLGNTLMETLPWESPNTRADIHNQIQYRLGNIFPFLAAGEHSPLSHTTQGTQ